MLKTCDRLFHTQLNFIAFVVKTSDLIPCLAYGRIFLPGDAHNFKFDLSLDGSNVAAGLFDHRCCS